MVDSAARPPVVLAAGGHDPCAGAGIQADIEAIAAQGCLAVTLITALTAQNTRGAVRCDPVDPGAFREQARVLIDDVPVAAVKIGLLPSVALVEAMAQVLRTLPPCPIVLDPVLAAGAGGALAEEAVGGALLERLFPHVTVATPNSIEARRLVPRARDPAQAARALLERGCGYVLVTGGHEQTANEVENVLYGPGDALERHGWPRLPHQYHGSGCTLAAALAARLAAGESVPEAARAAQCYTFAALQAGFALGHGQWHPRRLQNRRQRR